MKWIFSASVCFLLLYSCQKSNRIPGGILSRDKMQAVLWDMMRADQFLGDYVLSKDSSLKKDSVRISYYQKIFDIHKISPNEFQESFSYYKKRPALMGAILDSLSKTKAPSAQVATPVAKDSITPAANQRQSVIAQPSKDSVFRRNKVKKLQQTD